MKTDVETPPELKAEIYAFFNIDHDPCPLFGARDGPDGLDRNIPWGKNNFINPPYDKSMLPFIDRAIEEMAKGNNSYLLVPFRPAYRYYDKIFKHCTAMHAIGEHVVFVGYPKPYIYPIALFCLEVGKQPIFEQRSFGKMKVWSIKN